MKRRVTKQASIKILYNKIIHQQTNASIKKFTFAHKKLDGKRTCFAIYRTPLQAF